MCTNAHTSTYTNPSSDASTTNPTSTALRLCSIWVHLSGIRRLVRSIFSEETGLCNLRQGRSAAMVDRFQL